MSDKKGGLSAFINKNKKTKKPKAGEDQNVASAMKSGNDAAVQ
jgi:hypothetical protein